MSSASSSVGRRLGRAEDAAAAYRAAIEHTDNAAEIAFLRRRANETLPCR